MYEVVGTHTHDLDIGTRETVIISAPKDTVGSENSYPPQTPTKSELIDSMRAGVFVGNNDVHIQFPRDGDWIAGLPNSVEVGDIVTTEQSVIGLYPVDRETVVHIEWQPRSDEWAHTSRDLPMSYNEYTETCDILWSAIRSVE